MAKKTAAAILFFSRTASDEASAKTFNFRVGIKENIAIGQCLIDQIKRASLQTNLPFFSCYSTEQSGDYFGERLANALEVVFDKGHDQVIIIGNDCPFVTPSMLLDVNTQLEKENLILGPATDGGVYLIGIKKSAYQRNSFITLPWQEASLQNGWKHYSKAVSISINWLESHFDIDRASDFNKLLKVLPFYSTLRKKLVHIIRSHQVSNCLYRLPLFKARSFRHLPLRAPPVL